MPSPGSQSTPNQTRIAASVMSYEAAEDGFGGWADLAIETAGPPEDEEVAWSADLAGARVRAFVPPPLVPSVTPGARYEGIITLRGGGTSATYALVPARARPGRDPSMC